MVCPECFATFFTFAERVGKTAYMTGCHKYIFDTDSRGFDLHEPFMDNIQLAPYLFDPSFKCAAKWGIIIKPCGTAV